MSYMLLGKRPEAVFSLFRAEHGRRRLILALQHKATPNAVTLCKVRGRNLTVEAAAAANGDKPSSSGSDAGTVSGQRPRLAKVLAACGVASRRACEALIAAGRVRVNGRVVSEQGTTVEPLRDRVEVLQPQPSASVPPASSQQQQQQQRQRQRPQRQQKGAVDQGGGEAAEVEPKAVWQMVRVRTFKEPDSLFYFALNKPKGYICSSSDVGGRGKLVVELLEPWMKQWRYKNKNRQELPPRLFTVGRLDVASSGLIFVTNDGEWANRVIHPSFGVTKEYVVVVAEDTNRQQLEKLAAGTEVAGSLVSPLEVEVLGDPRRLRIVIQEGKKHEVRELVKAAAMELLSLRRVRIGGYRLPRDLGIGGFRELKPSDLRQVTDLKAQEAASTSGATRQEQQRQQQQRLAAAARAAVPRALRGRVSDEALELMRKVQG